MNEYVPNKCKKYTINPIEVEAIRWWQNGDHPNDHEPIKQDPTHFDAHQYVEYLKTDGAVVGRWPLKGLDTHILCNICGEKMGDHGWIQNEHDAQIVCPGDYVVTVGPDTYQSIRPKYFESSYVELPTEEPVDRSLGEDIVDGNGVPIERGDFIVYNARSYGSSYLLQGIVVGVSKRERWGKVATSLKLMCQKRRWNWRLSKYESVMAPSTVHYPNRGVVFKDPSVITFDTLRTFRESMFD